MSLEQNVVDLTLAIQALTAAISGGVPQKAPEQPVVEKPKTETKKSEKSATTAETKGVADTSSTASEAGSQTEDDLTGTEDSVKVPLITLTELAAKFTDLVEADRPAAVALLKEFGIAKLGQAKPEDYFKISVAIDGALNG